MKAARERLGITQSKLAKELDIDLKSVRFYENQEKTPSLQTLVGICKALNVSADELIGISTSVNFGPGDWVNP